MKTRSRMRRVAVIRSPGRIAPQVMDDIAESLTFLGHQVLKLDLTEMGAMNAHTRDEALACANRMVSVLCDFRPEMAMSYGLAGLVELGGENGRPTHLFEWLKIPYVCLFYDAPLGLAEPLSRWGPSPLASFVCWDRRYCPWMRSHGVRRLLYLPLGTNVRVFGKVRPVPSPSRACTFVGSLGVSRLESPLPATPALADAAQRFIARRLEDPCADVETLLDRVAAELPPESAAGFRAFLKTPQADRFRFDVLARSDVAYRQSGVARAGLSGGVSVFGDVAWERLALPGVVYGGPVAYGPDLARLYADAAINLNLTAGHLREALNQRMFDAPAAWGFVLTDYRRDLEDLFDLDREIACFRTLDELPEKLERFRQDGSARERVLKAARRRILAHHTWDRRVDALFAWLDKDSPAETLDAAGP